MLEPSWAYLEEKHCPHPSNEANTELYNASPKSPMLYITEACGIFFDFKMRASKTCVKSKQRPHPHDCIICVFTHSLVNCHTYGTSSCALQKIQLIIKSVDVAVDYWVNMRILFLFYLPILFFFLCDMTNAMYIGMMCLYITSIIIGVLICTERLKKIF